ncbi:hypothetical protein FH966_02275 [Lentibacillus cibarius]|uniref:Uncharacterized protein n=1 Tax=Lentibacillus cibarius TaxID=2583219 RepID=A0A549YFH5_9BACI|nr:hypothetical protein [Lentibacillus cibarius]TRM10641.1 hypothetical protein FH966_02275 [Lentibacillus cibarius]
MRRNIIVGLSTILLALIVLVPRIAYAAEGDVADPATQIPVLMYHGLLTEEEKQLHPNNSSYITKASFEKQMKYLAENGYHTVIPSHAIGARHFDNSSNSELSGCLALQQFRII